MIMYSLNAGEIAISRNMKRTIIHDILSVVLFGGWNNQNKSISKKPQAC